MDTAERIAAMMGQNNLDEKDLAAFLARKGWGVEHPSTYRIDLEQEFLKLWDRVSPYTMISPERGYAVYQGVHHILDLGVPGDLVECGVWKGGSCMLMALTLLQRGVTDRMIWLYDTFAGMTQPGPEDRIASSGQAVSERWQEGWWAVDLEQVRKNLESTAYPADRFRLIRGDVCKTLKEARPSSVSLLRLDTDWYESTLTELEVLYPRLEERGVLIVDDYGHFEGARQAVDDYFRGADAKPLLQRSDYTGRLAVKLPQE